MAPPPLTGIEAMSNLYCCSKPGFDSSCIFGKPVEGTGTVGSLGAGVLVIVGDGGFAGVVHDEGSDGSNLFDGFL